MKQVKGFWLPDGEQHLVPFLENGPEFAGGPTYQLHKLLAAMPHIRNFRNAIDVGAHCGLWSRPLSVIFRHVYAFEPVASHAECWFANVPGDNTSLIECALGSRAGEVSLHTGPSSSGDTFVQQDGEHAAEMRALDSFDFVNVDLIKLDCEGYEMFALQGGEQTIRRERATIIVEQKPGKASQYGLGDTDAVKLLQGWGMKLIKEISGDFILAW